MTQPTNDTSAKSGAADGTESDSQKTTADTDTEAAKPKDDNDVSGLKKALQAERKRANDLEKAQRDAEISKLPELEQAKARSMELEAENAKLKTEVMRRQVAMELGLPWSLGKRLTGDTEDEMRADGTELVKSYKVPDKQVIKDDSANKRPPNDAKRNGPAGQPGMNDILRALRRG